MHPDQLVLESDKIGYFRLCVLEEPKQDVSHILIKLKLVSVMFYIGARILIS